MSRRLKSIHNIQFQRGSYVQGWSRWDRASKVHIHAKSGLFRRCQKTSFKRTGHCRSSHSFRWQAGKRSHCPWSTGWAERANNRCLTDLAVPTCAQGWETCCYSRSFYGELSHVLESRILSRSQFTSMASVAAIALCCVVTTANGQSSQPKAVVNLSEPVRVVRLCGCPHVPGGRLACWAPLHQNSAKVGVEPFFP